MRLFVPLGVIRYVPLYINRCVNFTAICLPFRRQYSLRCHREMETSSKYPFWRWICFLARTWTLTWDALYILALVIPWNSPLSLRALCYRQPFIPRESGGDVICVSMWIGFRLVLLHVPATHLPSSPPSFPFLRFPFFCFPSSTLPLPPLCFTPTCITLILPSSLPLTPPRV